MHKEFLTVSVTPHHVFENLGTDLYSSAEDCLWELVRNSEVASMTNENLWEPERVKIEIFLTNKNPLSKNSTALVVLDHGRGFTEFDLERFCSLGPSQQRVSSRTQDDTGASQKGIGRFAAFALNKKSIAKDPNAGFYILTRTTHSGPVRVIEVIPAYLSAEKGGGFPWYYTEETSDVMKDIGPITGSFSAIVIPNSVLEHSKEIVEALKWRLPRKKNLAFELKVGGKHIIPEPLADKFVWFQPQNGEIEVYLDVTGNMDPNGGIWFTDARTGLRVVHSSALVRYLPDPYWNRKLIGDIVVPGLLANQNTSRLGLKKEFLDGPTWKKLCFYLSVHIKDRVEELLGDQVMFGNDTMSQEIDEIINMFGKAFGDPELPTFSPDQSLFDTDKERPSSPRSDTPTKTDRPDTPTKTDRPDKTPKPKKHLEQKIIRIGEKSYVLRRIELDQNILAQIDLTGSVIHINHENIYLGLPNRKEARIEHTLNQIIEAAVSFDEPYNVDAMRIKVGKIREQLFRKSK